MAKKSYNKQLLSQLLLAASVLVVLVAGIEATTQNDITQLAPTQLMLGAVVFGIFGLYLKD